MRWKRKKEVTSETAYCFSLKKRKYIFCRKSFFTTKHKILKRQKKGKKGNIWSGQLWRNIWSEKRQPVLLKCMRRKKKKEVASETASCFSLKKRKYIFCRKSFLQQNTKYLKKARKAKSGKKKKKSWAKRWLYLFASTDESQMLFLWRFFLNCPLLFVACCSTVVCCLQVAIDQDFKPTYNTLKTEVEIEIEATAKSKLKSKLRSKPQTETEIEIEADWKLKSKSKLRSTTEIEIEIEIDYWKRVQNGNRLRSRKDFSKSTSSPVSRTSGGGGKVTKPPLV